MFHYAKKPEAIRNAARTNMINFVRIIILPLLKEREITTVVTCSKILVSNKF